jgi:hypothetical protein
MHGPINVEVEYSVKKSKKQQRRIYFDGPCYGTETYKTFAPRTTLKLTMGKISSGVLRACKIVSTALRENYMTPQ